MNSRWVVALVLGVVLGAAGGAELVQKPRIAITVSAPADPFRAGTPVKVTIALKNISTSPFVFWKVWSIFPGTAERDFQIDVRDEHGDMPPFMEYGRQLSLGVLPARLIRSRLEPNGTTNDQADIAKIYQLKPGKYTVRAEMFDAKLGVNVLSNTVTVSVSE